MLSLQPKTKLPRKQRPALWVAIALAGLAAGPVQAQSLNLGGIKVDLGSSNGGLSAGVSVGSNVSVGATVGGGSLASVDAQVKDSTSANVTVGGGSLASADANLGDNVSVNANVGGSSLVNADVAVGGNGGSGGGGTGGGGTGGGGGNTGGNTGGGSANNGDTSGGGTGSGIPVRNLSSMTLARDATRSVCGTAGNFAAINGVSVFSRDGMRLGTIVGAYIENENLTRIRVMVDTNLVQNSGCVEYSTNNGEVRPEGIFLQTNATLLFAALGM